MTTVFPSKIDTWLLVVLVLAMAVSLSAAIAVVRSGASGGWWIAVLVAGLGVGLPLWLVLSTRYTLDSRELVVRSGPFRWRIALADIASITPTTNPLSSPALSLDRLRIDYGQGRSLMISPRERQEFLSAMKFLHQAENAPDWRAFPHT